VCVRVCRGRVRVCVEDVFACVRVTPGAILGLGLAYAGTGREEVLELLSPLVVDTDVPVEVRAIHKRTRVLDKPGLGRLCHSPTRPCGVAEACDATPHHTSPHSMEQDVTASPLLCVSPRCRPLRRWRWGWCS
jgi:hypothetical protein